MRHAAGYTLRARDRNYAGIWTGKALLDREGQAMKRPQPSL